MDTTSYYLEQVTFDAQARTTLWNYKQFNWITIEHIFCTMQQMDVIFSLCCLFNFVSGLCFRPIWKSLIYTKVLLRENYKHSNSTKIRNSTKTLLKLERWEKIQSQKKLLSRNHKKAGQDSKTFKAVIFAQTTSMLCFVQHFRDSVHICDISTVGAL